MMIKLHHLAAALLAFGVFLGAQGVHAKLPPPSPEAQAKADEAKAKTAWSDKVASYQLCLSMEKTAAHYYKTSGKDAQSATPTPPCADPGPFVYDAASSPATPPLEAAGAHSPAKTAAAPPSGTATEAEQKGAPKK